MINWVPAKSISKKKKDLSLLLDSTSFFPMFLKSLGFCEGKLFGFKVQCKNLDFVF